MARYRKNIGDWGEKLATAFLLRHGWQILERNFHTPVGEIDIVAVKGGDYYFVEVKTRKDTALATDLAIHPVKVFRLRKAIKTYCYRRGVGDVGIVLAGIIILVDKAAKTAKIRYVVLRD
ncbi:MAG: YraN family protein [Patescibacteria group bacterium]|nr:YraN family protein [Patescibacteria group bacterium]